MNVFAAVTTRPMLPKHARTLALAFTFAVAALSVPAIQAYAEPVDPVARCAAKTGLGQYEFYLPGTKVTDANGKKWYCGADGAWYPDYSSLQQSPTTRSPIVRVPVNSVLAPAVAR
jgi:hypothetical protein